MFFSFHLVSLRSSPFSQHAVSLSDGANSGTALTKNNLSQLVQWRSSYVRAHEILGATSGCCSEIEW